jgi:hypothetical protein
MICKDGYEDAQLRATKHEQQIVAVRKRKRELLHQIRTQLAEQKTERFNLRRTI